MKKIVLAIDSFKGCLTSAEAEKAAYHAVSAQYPKAEIISIPVSDGGEYMLESFISALGGKMITIRVRDPRMRMIDAPFGILPDGKTAVIEMAKASGLTLLPREERNPRMTSSAGTGDLIAAAIGLGCTDIIIGLGGSATCDAGMGMLQALGVQFDAPSIEDVTAMDARHASFAGRCIHVTIACDVQNPLFGADGAAYIYAPQKGASDNDVKILDCALRRFSKLIADCTGRDCSDIPGAGAAGGLGFALLSMFETEIRSGIELLLEKLHFDDIIRDADLIITGEGSADAQTLMGKLPLGILKHAQKFGIPALLIAGKIRDTDKLLREGFHRCIAVTPPDTPIEIAMQKETASNNIQTSLRKFFLSEYH